MSYPFILAGLISPYLSMYLTEIGTHAVQPFGGSIGLSTLYSLLRLGFDIKMSLSM